MFFIVLSAIECGLTKNFIHFLKVLTRPESQIIGKGHVSLRLGWIKLLPSAIHQHFKASASCAVAGFFNNLIGREVIFIVLIPLRHRKNFILADIVRVGRCQVDLFYFPTAPNSPTSESKKATRVVHFKVPPPTAVAWDLTLNDDVDPLSTRRDFRVAVIREL